MSRNTEDIRGKCWKVCIITTRLSSLHSLNATASYCTFSLTENIKVACWVNSGGKKCSSTLQHRRDFLRVQTVYRNMLVRFINTVTHCVFFLKSWLHNEHSVLCTFLLSHPRIHSRPIALYSPSLIHSLIFIHSLPVGSPVAG